MAFGVTTAHVAAHLNVRFPLETEGGRRSPHSGPARAVVDPLVAQMGGYLQAWCNGAAIKSSTLKAKSVERLANSHANSWAIGSAQGVTAPWRAFREFGTCTNIAAPNIAPGALATAVAANITRLTCFPGCTTKLVAIRHYTGSCLNWNTSNSWFGDPWCFSGSHLFVSTTS